MAVTSITIGHKYKVTANPSLNIRSGPGTNYYKIGSLKKGAVESAITMKSGWVRLSGYGYYNGDNKVERWVSGQYLVPAEDKTQSAKPPVVKDTTQNSPPPVVDNSNTGQDTQMPAYNPVTGEQEESSGYLPDIDSAFGFQGDWNDASNQSEFYDVSSVLGFFGMPYQFMPITDPRITTSSGVGGISGIGYEWSEAIIAHMPIVFLAPGRAQFMTKYNDEDRKTVLGSLIQNGANIATGGLDDLLKDNGRYYTFAYADSEYYKYVNPMCRIAAQFLELSDYAEAIGFDFYSMNWADFTRGHIGSLADIGSFLSIPFYVNADTSISESWSNSTTQSMIASTANSISDMGRELNFLVGNVQSAAGIELIANDAEVAQNIENINNMVNNLLGKGNFISNLASHLTTVAAGGKLQFPEIWSDSSFSRSYTLEFKFVSPEPDKLSIYTNILVPLFHLIGLVAPQSVSTNPNGYTNPFLVRAMYKGFFNVDTGIITSMSVQKGGEGMWTPDGLPTSVEVSIDIKDLYECMSITKTDTGLKYDTMSNTSQLDYIASLCGINIHKPEIARMVYMELMNNGVNKIRDLVPINIFGSIQDRVANSIMNIYRGV